MRLEHRLGGAPHRPDAEIGDAAEPGRARPVELGANGVYAEGRPQILAQFQIGGRETQCAAALVAAHGPNAQADITALSDRLADSAAALLPVGGDMDARIAAERAVMRTRLTAEAGEVATRLRWMICVITVLAAGFGVAILRVSRRG